MASFSLFNEIITNFATSYCKATLLRIIKLHTTNSTNDYLKEWIQNNTPQNFMLVVAETQTKGRGQMGTNWVSYLGKNLTFSMFVSVKELPIEKQFQLNQAVSLGLLFALKKHVPQVQIKWPNDILAGGKKTAGILIENTVSNSLIKHSIVGIGLNVNQTKFPSELTQATSLKILTNRDFNLDSLLLDIRDSIVQQILLLKNQSSTTLEKAYLNNLYLYEIPSIYKSKDNKKFNGTIEGVDTYGRLLIKKETGEIDAFGLKEVVFFKMNP